MRTTTASSILAAPVLAVALLSLTVDGCSLLNTTAVQCLSEAECLAKGPAFAHTTCDPTTKTCIAVEAGVGTCQHNSDCITASGNAAAICRKSDFTCQVLQTAECPDLLGTLDQVQNDDVVVLGLMSPFATSVGGSWIERAVRLAQGDFVTNVQGLPPVNGSGPRPVVFVSCEEQATGPAGAMRAATHLMSDLQVPIMIGPSNPTTFATILQQVGLSTGTMMISPTSTNHVLTTFGPNPASPAPLVWLLVGNDLSAYTLIDAFIQNILEPQLVSIGTKKAGEQTRLMVALESSVNGNAALNPIQQSLNINGQSVLQQSAATYNVFNLGNPADPVQDPNPLVITQDQLPAIYKFAPHIILFTFASSQAVPFIMQPIEASWAQATNGAPRPQYVLLDGDLVDTQLTDLLGQDPTIVNRIFFPSIFGEMVNDNLVGEFFTRFDQANMDLPVTGGNAPAAEYGYDTAYMAEYTLAAVGSAPLTGVNAARAASSLFIGGGGQAVTVDPGNIAMAFGMLSSGNAFTLTGLTGPLIFESSGARSNTLVDMNCTENQDGLFGPVVTGYYYDNTTKQAAGSWDQQNCPPVP